MVHTRSRSTTKEAADGGVKSRSEVGKNGSRDQSGDHAKVQASDQGGFDQRGGGGGDRAVSGWIQRCSGREGGIGDHTRISDLHQQINEWVEVPSTEPRLSTLPANASISSPRSPNKAHSPQPDHRS